MRGAADHWRLELGVCRSSPRARVGHSQGARSTACRYVRYLYSLPQPIGAFSRCVPCGKTRIPPFRQHVVRENSTPRRPCRCQTLPLPGLHCCHASLELSRQRTHLAGGVRSAAASAFVFDFHGHGQLEGVPVDDGSDGTCQSYLRLSLYLSPSRLSCF